MEPGNSKNNRTEKEQSSPLSLMDDPGQCPIQKGILEILAIQVYEIRQTDLIDCMNRLEYRDKKNRRFSYKNILPFLKDLEKKGLIVSNEKGVTCRGDFWKEIIEHLVVQDRYKRIAEQVLTVIPLIKPLFEEFYDFKRIKEFSRAILAAVFTNGQLADPDLIYRSGQRIKKFQKGETTPVLELFNQPFKPDLLDRMALSLRWKIIGYLLDDAQKKIIPCRAVMAYARSLLAEYPVWDNACRVLDHDLLAGRMNLHEFYLSGIQAPYTRGQLVQKAKHAMLCNNNKKALVLFKEALALLQKKTPEQTCFLKGYDDLFFLLALLGSDDSLNFHLGIDHIKNLTGSPDDADPPLLEVATSMLPLFRVQAGENIKPKAVFEFFTSMDDPMAAFFSILVMTWAHGENAGVYMKILEDIRDKAEACGFDWLTAEACALLAKLKIQEQVNKNKALNLHEELGTTSIVDLFEPVSEWKNALNALIRMEELKGQKKGSLEDPNPEKRLAWELKYNETSGICTITPHIQKRNKKSGWTRGKIISLQNLYNTYLELDWLSPHDHRICAVIEKENMHGNFGYYNNPALRFDMEKALPALVGHPFIFTENNFHTPVELVHGEPELKLSRHHQKLHIRMKPVPRDLSSGVVLVRENPVRYKVVQFTPDHISVARLIGHKDLIIPEKEEEKVSQAIVSVSSFLTVHSDFETKTTQAVEEKEADSTILVHLTPWLKGVRMETLVQPMGNKGTFFKPGHGSRYLLSHRDGQKIRIIRDLELETTNENNIIQACPTLEDLENGDSEWVTKEPGKTLDLLLELKESREKMILKWPRGERMRIRSRASASDFSLTLKKDREWFKATGNLFVDENTSLDLSRLMALLESSSGHFIPLDDGTFLAITKSLKARIEELKAYSTPHEEGLLFSPLAVPALEELTEQAGSLKTDQAWKDHCRKLKETVQPDIPRDLQAELRDYQVIGFHWLSRLAHWNLGGCLADDMGLGKTVQSLAAILDHASKGPALVVAPLSVMNNWKKECENFTPTLNPLIFGGKNRQEFLDGLGPFDLVICSYGLLQTEAEKLSGVAWQTIVLDEAQAIKNRKTKRSKAAMKLNANFRLITTGTPVENRLEELWTLFHFLNPGLLGSYHRFKQVFVLPIEGSQDNAASQRLRKLIRPFLLRRRKTEVLKELPEKTEIILQVEMSRDESVLYEAQRLKSLQSIEQSDDSPGQKQFRILAEITRLRKLCCNPSLILPDTDIESSKLKVFMDTVRELLENRHKVLVFSQFVVHLDILRKALFDENISFQYLDGSTPAKERQKRIHGFQNGIGDLFLISLKAGGTGLNLTAADYVIHMDPWWNPAVEDQASDRAHRIGQTRPVTVYRLVVKDSIEERIVKLHKEKRTLAENLLAGSEAAGKLSASELLALMQR